MKHYIFLIISPIALSGCMTIADYQQLSSGKIGCSPNIINISNAIDNDPIYSWQAECNKQIYYCSTYIQSGRNNNNNAGFFCSEQQKPIS